jgi:hypothetical protein
MGLYERILEEARREGVEHQTPTASRTEPTGELANLRSLTFHGPSSCWTGMAYKSLQHKYPAEHLRYLLEKNGGSVFSITGGESRALKS